MPSINERQKKSSIAKSTGHRPDHIHWAPTCDVTTGNVTTGNITSSPLQVQPSVRPDKFAFPASQPNCLLINHEYSPTNVLSYHHYLLLPQTVLATVKSACESYADLKPSTNKRSEDVKCRLKARSTIVCFCVICGLQSTPAERTCIRTRLPDESEPSEQAGHHSPHCPHENHYNSRIRASDWPDCVWQVGSVN